MLINRCSAWLRLGVAEEEGDHLARRGGEQARRRGCPATPAAAQCGIHVALAALAASSGAIGNSLTKG